MNKKKKIQMKIFKNLIEDKEVRFIVDYLEDEPHVILASNDLILRIKKDECGVDLKKCKLDVNLIYIFFNN